MLHRLDGLAVGILIFIRRSLPHKLLAGLWMLALAEFREVLGRDGPGKAELPGQSALPFARDDAALRPIVLLLRSELLLVVGLRLASGERLGNGQHGSYYPRRLRLCWALTFVSTVGLLLRYLRRCPWRFSRRRCGHIWLRLQFKRAQLGLSRSDVFGIVGELVVGRIAEIEVTGDNRHIEVRE